MTWTVTVEAVNDGPTILGGTSLASIVINSGNIWDTSAVFGHAFSSAEAANFLVGDAVTLDVTVQPQGGLLFSLLDETNSNVSQFDTTTQAQFPTLPWDGAVLAAVGENLTESYTITGDNATSLNYYIYSFFGGNPGGLSMQVLSPAVLKPTRTLPALSLGWQSMTSTLVRIRSWLTSASITAIWLLPDRRAT